MKQQCSRLRTLFTAAALIALGGCTAIPPSPQQPPERPTPVEPAPPPPQVSAQPWDQRPFDAGAWRYDGRTRTAVFAQSGAPLLNLSCAGGSLRMSTERFASNGQPLSVDLKTSSGITRLRFEPLGANGSVLTLAASDNKLDQIAFSRGRFALDASNGRHMTVPVHSEIGRVIEDCRG